MFKLAIFLLLSKTEQSTPIFCSRLQVEESKEKALISEVIALGESDQLSQEVE